MEIPEIWLYLVIVIVLLIVVFVAYIKYKLISKAELLQLIDRVIAEDNRLIPTLPPKDAEKLRIKNQALTILKRAIEEGWIPIAAEEKMLETLKVKRK